MAKKTKAQKQTINKAETYPKVTTRAIIDVVSFSSTKGSDVRFKGMTFSPHQCERLMQLCDANEPVELTLTELQGKLFGDEPLLEQNGGKAAQDIAKNAKPNKPQRTVGELTAEERKAAKEAQEQLLGTGKKKK